MHPEIEILLVHCTTQDGTEPEAVQTLCETYPGLPEDYQELLREANGLQGWIGPSSFLMIHPVELLDKINKAANTSQFAPGMLLFGSDGGGMAYAFDTRAKPYTVIEAASEALDWDEVWTTWPTFLDFLKALAERE